MSSAIVPNRVAVALNVIQLLAPPEVDEQGEEWRLDSPKGSVQSKLAELTIEAADVLCHYLKGDIRDTKVSDSNVEDILTRLKRLEGVGIDRA